jgi:hypothetical protein
LSEHKLVEQVVCVCVLNPTTAVFSAARSKSIKKSVEKSVEKSVATSRNSQPNPP